MSMGDQGKSRRVGSWLSSFSYGRGACGTLEKPKLSKEEDILVDEIPSDVGDITQKGDMH